MRDYNSSSISLRAETLKDQPRSAYGSRESLRSAAKSPDDVAARTNSQLSLKASGSSPTQLDMSALSKKTRNTGFAKQQSNHNSVTSISFPSKHLKAKKVGIAYETTMFTGRLNIEKYMDI